MVAIKETLCNKEVWKAVLSEFLGTLILVFVCVAGGFSWDGQPATNLQISLTNGLTVATLIQIFGNVGGCLINPAVTLAMLLFKHIKPIVAFLYIIFQCLGAVVGAALLKAVTPFEVQGGLGVTLPNPNLRLGQVFGMEFCITLILILTIFAVSDENRDDIKGSIPLAVGLTVTACSLIANSYTGACMNPARSFGPAVVTQNWTEHWIYWFAPCAGGMVGAVIYHNAFRVKHIPKDKQLLFELNFEPSITGLKKMDDL